MSQINVIRDCRLQYGREHLLLAAVPPGGAIPVGKTIRLGLSVCLRDELCMPLCSYIVLHRSGTSF